MQQMFQEICLSFQTVVSFAFELPMNGKQATEVWPLMFRPIISVSEQFKISERQKLTFEIGFRTARHKFDTDPSLQDKIATDQVSNMEIMLFWLQQESKKF